MASYSNFILLMLYFLETNRRNARETGFVLVVFGVVTQGAGGRERGRKGREECRREVRGLGEVEGRMKRDGLREKGGIRGRVRVVSCRTLA